MIAFDTGSLRCLTFTESFIGQHGLADMDPTIVDQIHLFHIITRSSQDS